MCSQWDMKLVGCFLTTVMFVTVPWIEGVEGKQASPPGGHGETACSVFEPFRVSPENAKFVLGGVFALHQPDCRTVKPDAVQELLAVQWALSHWNQNPANAQHRIALYAGDSCSRANASVAQVINYLAESGKLAPSDCLVTAARRPLGLILPASSQDSSFVANTIQTAGLPSLAYSTGSAEGFPGTFSVAPNLFHYLELALNLLQSLKINHVTLVSSLDDSSPILQRIKQYLASKEFIVADVVISLRKDVAEVVDHSPARAVLLIAPKSEVFRLFEKVGIGHLELLHVILPLEGEVFNSVETGWMSNSISKAVVIFLQQQIADLPSFRAYFLDILKNNFQAYPLLASYMEQKYNCTYEPGAGSSSAALCHDVPMLDLQRFYHQSPNVENVVLAAYAFASLASSLTTGSGKLNEADMACWLSSEDHCQDSRERLLESLKYEFAEYDPREFQGFILSFDKGGNAERVLLEGFQLLQAEDGEVLVSKIIEASTDLSNYHVDPSGIRWPTKLPIVSHCPRYNPACRQCKRERSDSIFKLHKSGDLYILGLFDWHLRGRTGANHLAGRVCGPIAGAREILFPLSFVYALETAKTRYGELRLLNGVNIGALLLDSCGNAPATLNEVGQIEHACTSVRDFRALSRNISVHPDSIAGYIAGLPGDSMGVVQSLFGNHGIASPLGAPMQRSWSKVYNMYSNMPLFETQANAIIKLLRHFNWNYVSILLSELDIDSIEAFKAFRERIEGTEICIADVLTLQGRGQSAGESFKKQQSQAARVAIAFATARDTAYHVRSQASKFTSKDPTVLILIGDAHNWEIHLQRPTDYWKEALFGALSLQPKLPMASEDLRRFLGQLSPETFPEPWFIDFWQNYFECVLPSGERKFQRDCEGSETFPQNQIGRLTKESYLMSSLELMLFSLDGVYRKLCPEQQGLCETFFDHYHSELNHLLRDVPRQSTFQLYNYQHHPSTGYSGYVEIGNWTKNEGILLGEPYQWVVDNELSYTPPASQCRPPLCRCQLEEDFFARPIDDYLLRDSEELSELNPTHTSSDNVEQSSLWTSPLWKQRTWSYIFMIIAGVLLLCAIGVLVLICVKLCQRVVKGNQSLGICLLCGVILLYISSFFFIFDPSYNLCRLRYVMHSLAYSLCFGVMLSKGVQLRNSHTIGFNGYISFWNYWLLLGFIVCVQLALNIQWCLFKYPTVTWADAQSIAGDENGSLGGAEPGLVATVLRCEWSEQEFMMAQAYVIVLLLLSLLVSLLSRNVKRNYKEARWLAYTSAICIPVWLAWLVAYATIPRHFQDTVVVMEMLTCATVILCFMFGPKLYILLSYEPVLVDCTGSTYGYAVGAAVGTDASSPRPRMAVADGRGSPRAPEFRIDEGYDEGDDCPSEPGHHYGGGGGFKSPCSSSASTKSTGIESVTTSDGGRVYAAVVRKKSRNVSRFGRNAPPSPGAQCDSVAGKRCAADSLNPADALPQPFTLEPVYRTNPIYGPTTIDPSC